MIIELIVIENHNTFVDVGNYIKNMYMHRCYTESAVYMDNYDMTLFNFIKNKYKGIFIDLYKMSDIDASYCISDLEQIKSVDSEIKIIIVCEGESAIDDNGTIYFPVDCNIPGISKLIYNCTGVELLTIPQTKSICLKNKDTCIDYDT